MLRIALRVRLRATPSAQDDRWGGLLIRQPTAATFSRWRRLPLIRHLSVTPSPEGEGYRCDAFYDYLNEKVELAEPNLCKFP